MAATNALRRTPADLSAGAGRDFRCLSVVPTSRTSPRPHQLSYFVNGVNGFGSSSSGPGFTRGPG